MQSWNIETAPGKTVRNFELGSLCALVCCAVFAEKMILMTTDILEI